MQLTEREREIAQQCMELVGACFLEKLDFEDYPSQILFYNKGDHSIKRTHQAPLDVEVILVPWDQDPVLRTPPISTIRCRGGGIFIASQVYEDLIEDQGVSPIRLFSFITEPEYQHDFHFTEYGKSVTSIDRINFLIGALYMLCSDHTNQTNTWTSLYGNEGVDYGPPPAPNPEDFEDSEEEYQDEYQADITPTVAYCGRSNGAEDFVKKCIAYLINLRNLANETQ